MRIEQHLFMFFILALNLIISGCGTPTQADSESTSNGSKIKTPTPSETSDFSANTLPPTLHPSLINCVATPLIVVNKELPDTPEAQEIFRTVQKSVGIYSEALRTSDPSKFPTVFINDPRFLVSPETLDTVRRLTGNPSLQSAGWLDYKMAYYTWQIKEGTHLQVESLHTPELPQTLPPEFVWCSPPPALNFSSINIEGDIATVVIEGCGTYELTLVLVNSRWFIAAYKGLSRCYP